MNHPQVVIKYWCSFKGPLANTEGCDFYHTRVKMSCLSLHHNLDLWYQHQLLRLEVCNSGLLNSGDDLWMGLNHEHSFHCEILCESVLCSPVSLWFSCFTACSPLMFYAHLPFHTFPAVSSQSACLCGPHITVCKLYVYVERKYLQKLKQYL